MLEVNELNIWAIVVIWFINMIVGSFWYSPAGFSKQWKKYTGVDLMKLPKNEANRAISFVAVSALVQAVVLALILNSLDPKTVLDGLIAGIVLWAGLVAATTVGTTFYSRRGWGFWILNNSYFLIVMSINSIILTVWR